MKTHDTFDALAVQADALRADLAAVLETLARLEEHDKAILQARYLAMLGVSEFRLMELQVESLALQRRIERIQACLNRGETVSGADLAQVEREIESEMLVWQSSLLEKETAISEADLFLSGLIEVPAELVQHVKTVYRRLARLLHPDVSPQHQALFERYWNSVQQAYQVMDAALLVAVLHLVEHEVEATRDNVTQDEIARLQSMLTEQLQRLTQLQNSAPFCYARLLDDENWISAKRRQLEESIELAAGRHAQLLARYAALKAKIVEN